MGGSGGSASFCPHLSELLTCSLHSVVDIAGGIHLAPPLPGPPVTSSLALYSTSSSAPSPHTLLQVRCSLPAAPPAADATTTTPTTAPVACCEWHYTPPPVVGFSTPLTLDQVARAAHLLDSPRPPPATEQLTSTQVVNQLFIASLTANTCPSDTTRRRGGVGERERDSASMEGTLIVILIHRLPSLLLPLSVSPTGTIERPVASLRRSSSYYCSP